MPFRWPFGDDDVPAFDIVLLVVALVVIGVAVAWAAGLL